MEKINGLLQQYPEEAKAYESYRLKPNGGRRKIATPDPELNAWLKNVNNALWELMPKWPDFMHGGIRGRSFVTHASTHIKQPVVITLDIEKCFDSIKPGYIENSMVKRLSVPQGTANQMASLLCHNGRLAQGFASSSFICNLCLLDPMELLMNVLEKLQLKGSCYVDDLAISGNIKSPKEAGGIIDEAFTIFKKFGLRINRKKVNVMPARKPQIICGIKVNHRLSITKDYRNKVFRMVADTAVDIRALNGMVAHISNIDPKLSKKLKTYMSKRQDGDEI